MDIESIAFRDENGAEHMFYVEEQTRINGTDYLLVTDCLLYTSPSPRDKRQSRMPSSA